MLREQKAGSFDFIKIERIDKMTELYFLTRQPSRTASPPLALDVCAGHGTRLVGWKSRYQVIAEPKVSERARALSRGRV